MRKEGRREKKIFYNDNDPIALKPNPLINASSAHEGHHDSSKQGSE
jgi:hypothetical protein